MKLFYVNKRTPPLLYEPTWTRFLKYEAATAVMLLCASMLAVVLANLPFTAQWYETFWTQMMGISIGPFRLEMPLRRWVNDGLMSWFFFLVGLEIKHEVLGGHLSTRRKALLPIAGAAGGMLFPAMIYLAINAFSGEPDQSSRMLGWGIPTATDIAFAAGCLRLVSSRVPHGLVVFLVALAIVDDIGAVLVIAIFYTGQLALQWLALGLLLVVIAYIIGQMGVDRALFFMIVGAFVWVCFLASGIHASITGVVMALAVPVYARYDTPLYPQRVKFLLELFEDLDEPGSPRVVNPKQQGVLRSIFTESFHVESPLQRLHFAFQPMSMYFIMPVFAFANSGVQIDFAHLGSVLMQPVAMGAGLGLLLGKQMGICLVSFACIKLGIAALPRGVNFKQFWALSWMAGIGFTMSLFITELAYPVHPEDHAIPIMLEQAVEDHAAAPEQSAAALERTALNLQHGNEAKLGIFLGSVLSGMGGLLLLRFLCPELDDLDEEEEDEEHGGAE